MNTMKVFSDGYDTYVGEDLVDALKAREEFSGPHDEINLDDWHELDLNKPKTIWFEPYDAEKKTFPAGAAMQFDHYDRLRVTAALRDWAEHNGRGFLCSTEY